MMLEIFYGGNRIGAGGTIDISIKFQQFMISAGFASYLQRQRLKGSYFLCLLASSKQLKANNKTQIFKSSNTHIEPLHLIRFSLIIPV